MSSLRIVPLFITFFLIDNYTEKIKQAMKKSVVIEVRERGEKCTGFLNLYYLGVIFTKISLI